MNPLNPTDPYTEILNHKPQCPAQCGQEDKHKN